MNVEKYLDIAINDAVLAGLEILPVYASKDFEIELKQDNSPLTKGDKLTHSVISEVLQKSSLPVLAQQWNGTLQPGIL